MTGFWLLALAMGVVAAAFVVWPLIIARGDDRGRQIRARSNLAIFEDRLAELRADLEAGHVGEEEFGSLRAELERSLLQDVDEAELDAAGAPRSASRSGRRVLLASALAVPLVAVALYADWGLSWGAMSELQLARDMEQLDAPRPPDAESAGEADGDMAELATRLENRLEADPEDADGWFLLGRTRLQLGEFEAAASAFGEVAARSPDSLAPKVFRAQALYLAEDRELTPRVREVVDAVLEQEPGQPIMLELLAMDAFRDGRFAEAAEGFARVLETPVRDPARREFLEDGLARARDLAGLPAQDDAGSDGDADTDAADPDDPRLRVEVRLAPDLLEGLPASARVFVLARAAGGPRMPLAVQRVAPDERISVTLSAADAMSPEATLTSVDRVEVVARLSLSGDAMPAESDVEARSRPLPTDRDGRVELTLGEAAPDSARNAGDEAGDASIRVLVELDSQLQAPEGATLFVFARAAAEDSPPAPLAAVRLEAGALPTLVTLDDSMAMMPGRTLSAADRVRIVARVTEGDGVRARSGDLEGSTEALDPVKVDRVVPLLIDRRIP